jgi:copper transport protein
MSILCSRLQRRLAVLVAVVSFLLCGASPAYAHALLLRSDPAEGALLQASPRLVHLWFSEDLNASASKIIVWDRHRRVLSAGAATSVPGRPRQLEVRLKTLSPGSYLVLWTSVSAQDGHVLHGYYLFSVKVRGPGPSLAGVSTTTSQGWPDGQTLASLLAHWLELLAAVCWVGAVAFSAFVTRAMSGDLDGSANAGERKRLGWTIGISVATLVAASTVVLVAQAYSLDGNSWGAILSRSTLGSIFGAQYGELWIARQALALVALLAVIALFRSNKGSFGTGGVRGANSVQFALGLVYLYLFAGSGHAASANIGNVAGSSIVSGAVFLDWLHFLADAAWFGGQMYIVLVLIPALRVRRDASHARTFLRCLDRFSPVAYAGIATYVLSGAFAAKIHIPSWYAFFNSIYGRALIVKMALIGLMMLCSTLTVFLLRPRLKRRMLADGERTSVSAPQMSRLLRWLGVNPVLGVGVLLAASVMFYYPVPTGFGPSGPNVYVTQSGGVSARLHVTPDRSGANQLTISLRRLGKPVRTAHVTVLTTMLDMEMGSGLVPMSAVAPGTYRGTADLGMGGHWRLQILVFQPQGLTRMSVKVQVGT